MQRPADPVSAGRRRSFPCQLQQNKKGGVKKLLHPMYRRGFTGTPNYRFTERLRRWGRVPLS